MIDHLLQRAQNEGHVISVYTDREDTDRFSAGFIQCISDQLVLIAHISPFGLYDGFVLKHHQDIYRVEYQGQYENKIERLYHLQNQSHKKVSCNADTLVEDLLLFAYENRLMVSIELSDSQCNDIQGKVRLLQDNHAVILQLDPYGKEDGETVVSLSDISLVTCDSDEEIALRLLYEDNIK